jgi:cytochrome d ubiquinol oxidase subunit I
MTDFASVVFNPNIFTSSHVIFSGLATGTFFILGISAYHLVRKNEVDIFRRSFKMAAITGLIFSVLIAINGHAQGQHMVQSQPMKMAAAEALWESEDPASFSLFAISDVENQRNIFAIRIPLLLSFLSYNRLEGEVKGINNLQAEFEAQYGPGDYVPPVIIPFWSFRLMVGAGTLMILLSLFALFLLRPGKWNVPMGFKSSNLVFAAALPGKYRRVAIDRSRTFSLGRLWVDED